MNLLIAVVLSLLATTNCQTGLTVFKDYDIVIYYRSFEPMFVYITVKPEIDDRTIAVSYRVTIYTLNLDDVDDAINEGQQFFKQTFSTLTKFSFEKLQLNVVANKWTKVYIDQCRTNVDKYKEFTCKDLLSVNRN